MGWRGSAARDGVRRMKPIARVGFAGIKVTSITAMIKTLAEVPIRKGNDARRGSRPSRPSAFSAVVLLTGDSRQAFREPDRAP